MAYYISENKSDLDVAAIHDYLSNKSYWAKGRSLAKVKQSIDNSMCFGLYGSSSETVGFARVVTDTVVFAYLMDFFIFEEHQGNGLGKMLLQHILGHADLQVRLWFLGTASAHGFYKNFDFIGLDNPDRFMLKRDIAIK